MWFPRVDFRTSRGVREDLWGGTAIPPARAGTNILEYARLTELTRNLIYFKNVPSSSPQDKAEFCRRQQRGGHLSNLLDRV